MAAPEYMAVEDARRIFLTEVFAMRVDKAITILNRERSFRIACEGPDAQSDGLMALRPAWLEVVQAVFVLRGTDEVIIRMLTVTELSYVFVHFDLPPILQSAVALLAKATM